MTETNVLDQLDELIKQTQAELNALRTARDTVAGDDPTEPSPSEKAKRRQAALKAWDTRRKRDAAAEEALAEASTRTFDPFTERGAS